MKNLYSNTELDQIAKNSIDEKGCQQVWESYLNWKSNGNEDKCYVDYLEHLISEFFEFLDGFSIEKLTKIMMEVSAHERRN